MNTQHKSNGVEIGDIAENKFGERYNQDHKYRNFASTKRFNNFSLY